MRNKFLAFMVMLCAIGQLHAVGSEFIFKALYFDSGSVRLESKADSLMLDTLVMIMNEHMNFIVQIDGSSDAYEVPVTDSSISYGRCQTVANYLIAHGITESRIVLQAHGGMQPMLPNDTREGTPWLQGMAVNRHVRFAVIGSFNDK